MKKSSCMGEVVRIKKNGDAVVKLHKEMCTDLDIRPGDSFYFSEDEVSEHIVLTRCILFSRLKREWKKYMRRMDNFDIGFEVIRADKIVGKLKPTDSKYHLKQFRDEIG